MRWLARFRRPRREESRGRASREERRLPLLTGEQVLAVCRVQKGRFYATNRRLLFYRRHFREETYTDLNYGEVTSITLEVMGRRASTMVMAVMFLVGAVVVFFLSRLISPGQAIHILGGLEISAEVGRLAGLLLAVASGLWGMYRFLEFLHVGRRYTLEGPGLLSDGRRAALWEIVSTNRSESAHFIAVMREQALDREVTQPMLRELSENMTAIVEALHSSVHGPEDPGLDQEADEDEHGEALTEVVSEGRALGADVERTTVTGDDLVEDDEVYLEPEAVEEDESVMLPAAAQVPEARPWDEAPPHQEEERSNAPRQGASDSDDSEERSSGEGEESEPEAEEAPVPAQDLPAVDDQEDEEQR